MICSLARQGRNLNHLKYDNQCLSAKSFLNSVYENEDLDENMVYLQPNPKKVLNVQELQSYAWYIGLPCAMSVTH